MSKEHKNDSSEMMGIPLTRRRFAGGLGATVGALSLGSLGRTATAAETVTGGDVDRLNTAYELRVAAAEDLLDEETAGSGTYERFDRLHGTYTKALPHNDMGEVDLDAYEVLDEALAGTDVSEYNEIPLAKDRGLANPIAARAYNLMGADPHQEPMPEAPAVGSDRAAAEMVELYWRALLRDVPFEAYDENELARRAFDELDSLDGYTGPTADGPGQDLFRVDWPGVREGPFISQFLLQDCPYGPMRIDSRIDPQAAQVDYLTEEAEWLNVRRGDGDVIRTEEYEGERTRIRNGRDLLTYVHRNIPSQSALSAAYFLESAGAPRAESISNRNLQTQNQFVEAGPPTTATLVAGVVDNAKHATWYHKWLVHRRSRPEKYGGLVHYRTNGVDLGEPIPELPVGDAHEGSTAGESDGSEDDSGSGRDDEGGSGHEEERGSGGQDNRGSGGEDEHGTSRPDGSEEVDTDFTGQPYDFLNDDVLTTSEAVRRTKARYGTTLLPQGYPEGSPTHPSYPAGHAVFIGASVTVLKALFDGDYVLDRTVRVDGSGDLEETDEELTVRGELNKLATNHAFGRDFAGIHYRTDGTEGIKLGERVALEYLKDELRGTATDVELDLVGFEGDAITVRGGEIRRN